MKAFKVIIVSAVMALTCAFAPANANAQFRIGPKAGLTVNSFHFNNSVFDDNNRTGFTAGLMTEFTVPVVGVGFDLSLMYVRRNAEWLRENNYTKDNRDYIEIPLNFKWKFSIPLVSKIVRPYLTTGPSIAFLTSRKAFNQMYHNKKYDAAWNFGFGVELLSHLQVGASYGLGMTKAVKAIGGGEAADISSKNRYWTVSAAYLF
ncbi:MAG: PorT family protein [Muribaculaceae bacterium]|nr:PorT family protein [Muribaculaceae bacterium]